MSDGRQPLQRESMALRIVWMALYALVWQVLEIVLVVVIVLQLGYRLFCAAPNAALLRLGDSLSQYAAQIGRFGTFNTDEKPWPFTDWPVAQTSKGEACPPR